MASLLDLNTVGSEDCLNEWIKFGKIVSRLLFPSVRGMIVKDKQDVWMNKICESNGKSDYPSTLAERLGQLISSHSELERHRNRKIFSIDCRTLKKGDAYGWMEQLSKELEISDNPILLIEHITEIPDGDRSIYDDPFYVKNILVHSWKNDRIYIGDIHIDRSRCTVWLTCTPDTQDALKDVWMATDSFAWSGEINI